MHGEIRLGLDLLGVALAQLDQVLARAERLGAGAGDDGHAQRRLVVKPLEDPVQVPVHREGDRVHLLHPVDRHEQHIGRWAREQHRWVGGARGRDLCLK